MRPRRFDLAILTATLVGAACVKVDLGAITFGRGDASPAEVMVVFDTGVGLDVMDATASDSSDAPMDTPDDTMDAGSLPPDVVTPVDVPTEINDAGFAPDIPDVTPTIDVPQDVSMPSCSGGQILCAGACVDLTSNAMHCGMCGATCPSGVCSGGRCQPCTSPRIQCGAACVDLNTDSAHCGACGRACPVGRSCVGGVCVP